MMTKSRAQAIAEEYLATLPGDDAPQLEVDYFEAPEGDYQSLSAVVEHTSISPLIDRLWDIGWHPQSKLPIKYSYCYGDHERESPRLLFIVFEAGSLFDDMEAEGGMEQPF